MPSGAPGEPRGGARSSGWRALAGGGAEALLLCFAIALRLRLAETYDPSWGYDAESHLGTLRYLAQHGAMPPLHLFRAGYNPPLFYWLAAIAARHGATEVSLRAIDLWAAIARLALLAWGLRRLLPESRPARLAALGLAAVLPAALQVDGMLSNEALSILLCTAALLLAALALGAVGRRRWALSAGLAAALSLALLTKVSGLAVAAAVAPFVVADAARARAPLRARLQRALPLALALAAALAVALPVYARHRAECGHLIANGYDTVDAERAMRARIDGVPYLERRPARFVFGLGAGAIFARPYYPSDVLPEPRFLPVLLASSFADYYNYTFAGMPATGELAWTVNGGPLADRTLKWARASVAAGLLIALATVAGLAGAAVWLWRRRDLARLMLLAAPLVALAGQLHFAIAYPFDEEGPIKGVYLQFAAAPLFAAFGAQLAWLWRRGWLRALAVLELGALALVAGYSLHALHVDRIGSRSAEQWVEPRRDPVRARER